MDNPTVVLRQIERWVNNPKLSDEEVFQHTVQALQASCKHFHWTGIYLLQGNTLVLGPYVGKHTDHTRIPVGVGVCGTAVAKNENQIVDDVRERDNYLACSLETRAEIVVLIRDGDRILGQIDIDSDIPNAFTSEDEQFLNKVADLLSKRLR
jgi:L-methionine (R)-S-oxide reductase